MYYVIREEKLYLYADSKTALEAYSLPVRELAGVTTKDFDREKYIVEDDNLVINPNYAAEQAEKKRAARIEEIKEALNELDKKRIRAMCEPSSKTTGQSWLEYYNEQARTLRKELQTLGVSE